MVLHRNTKYDNYLDSPGEDNLKRSWLLETRN